MTPEQLIHEGRILQRPSVFLRPEQNGPVAAVWFQRDGEELAAADEHCWLTVNSRHIPGLPPSLTGYLSIYTDEVKCEGGRVQFTPSWLTRAGTHLHAYSAQVLPPAAAA